MMLGDDSSPGFWSSLFSSIGGGYVAASPQPTIPIVPGSTVTIPGMTMPCPVGSVMVGTTCMPIVNQTPWYMTPIGIGVLAVGGFVAYKMLSKKGSTSSSEGGSK